MSTARYRSAPVSTSTSRRLGATLGALALLAALHGLAAPSAEAGEAAPTPAEIALAQIELDYAKSGTVYLLVDPKTRVLEIKVRGMVLESLPLAGVGFYSYRRAQGGETNAPIELPGVWTIDEDATAPYRKVIAPSELVPYSEDAEPPPPPPGAPKTPEGEHAPMLPDSYRVRLDRGLELSVGPSLPPTGARSRLLQAFADGWARIRRRPVERPTLLSLALDPEAANKLHFRLRADTPLIVASP